MTSYDNYIFDLYGTLLDTFNDEHSADLWEKMAGLYNVYGCNWTGEGLADAYWKKDREEREVIRQKSGTHYPEIKLQRVFARLLLEAPSYHDCSYDIRSRDIDELSESELVHCLANSFRVLSRERFRLYGFTLMLLKELKRQGKGVYLLSNAAGVFTMPEIEQSGISPYFDAMYISSDHYIMKPDPKFMEILINEQGLDRTRSVMVGNEIRSDVSVAVSSGMNSIYVNTGSYEPSFISGQIETLWAQNGYDDSLKPHIIYDPQKASPADFFL
ncbi:MAG: HAD family hydrolase [Clostridiales bacterium]|nr:HAD family hydrolase [Clostridiales bacterium]